MKKRNKIRLPPSENDSSNAAVVQASFSLLQEELNEEIEPVPLKKNIKRIQNLELGTDEKAEPEYDNLFRREEVKILNLEDMDTPVAATMATHSEPLLKEKDYVKLLEKDEKKEIMDRVKYYGSDSNDDLDEYEDDRLAVSTSEKRLQSERRKRLIQEALNDTESVSKWETSLMQRVQVERGPVLPKMRQNPGGDHLAAALSKVQLRKLQLCGQLQSLQEKKESLRKRREDVIGKIRKLAAH